MAARDELLRAVDDRVAALAEQDFAARLWEADATLWKTDDAAHQKLIGNALGWLKLNRASWGIESGLHQRLDVSHLDDLSRVRNPSSMLFMGMFRRLSNSLCLHWIGKQPRPHHKTTADFFCAMNAEHHRYSFRALFASRPSFSTAS